MKNHLLIILSIVVAVFSCKDKDNPVKYFSQTYITVNNKVISAEDTFAINDLNAAVLVAFPNSLDTSTIRDGLQIQNTTDKTNTGYSYTIADGSLSITPNLHFGKVYEFDFNNQLKGSEGQVFNSLKFYISVSAGNLTIKEITADGKSLTGATRVGGVSFKPEINIVFSDTVDASVSDYIKVLGPGKSLAFDLKLTNPTTAAISVQEDLTYLNKYGVYILDGYNTNGYDLTATSYNFYTKSDSTLKFPEISDDDLMTLVQSQTFKYFYDNAGSNSGLAKERNNAGTTVTTGGSGFGIMGLIVAMDRGFITRADGLARMEKILTYLESADRFHGAYSHWIDDTSGKVIPFSTKDNGGDLVETSFLFQGLLTYRQYMNAADTRESAIIDRINNLWETVEWSWYTNGGQNVLWWHWSPDYNFEINFQLKGYYEAMITYILAASSPTYSIPKEAYYEGWMRNGAVVNGKQFYGITLPIGYDYGGPLFFAHYSFLGLDPRHLQDKYCNYWDQNVAHSEINYEFCVLNPNGDVGYNGIAWGLTASDDPSGYGVHEPTKDNGTISPTAALSSMPYTPEKSIAAMKYFYYIIGDRLWGDYGFYDAYNVNKGWWASSTLAIDQGPIIAMIENHRTGLLWDLFMSAPEIQAGLQKLDIQYE